MLAIIAAATLLQGVTAPTASDIATLSQTVETIAAAHPMDTARIGVSVVDVDDGTILYERDAGHEFAPASNFKLLTAATALAYLGADYRFVTHLVARGTLVGDTLGGDLILVGGGDPTLTRADLASAAASVARSGIRHISGTVLIDDSIFDEQRYGAGWAWDDFPYYYQPPIQALAVDEGLAKIVVSPGTAIGLPLTAQMESGGDAMSVTSEATTTGAGGTDDYDCFRSPGSSVIRIVGHMPIGTKPDDVGCAVEDSAVFARTMFASFLRTEGVTLGARPLGALPPSSEIDIEDATPAPMSPLDFGEAGQSTLLWTHRSDPLSAILSKMMPPSDNFVAEHLFKMLPVVQLHQRGTFDGGLAVERLFLASLGLDPATVDGGDGSGLSQGDRITPHDLTAILAWEGRSSTGSAFVDALARAGINGTVRHRLLGSDAVGRVRAKDGYIWHVTTFSGYANTQRHGLVAFSVMVNDANGDLAPYLAAEDKIVETIVDWP